MTSPIDFDACLRRAEAEIARHRPVTAYLALWRPFEELAPEAKTAEGPTLLHPALRIALEHFGDTAEPTIDAARALASLVEDPFVWAVLGAGLSLKSRETWNMRRARKKPEDRKALEQRAWQQAREAERNLLRALDAAPHDADSWGVLGGLRSRLADWTREGGDEDGARAYEQGLLQAYRRGWEEGPDAYPAINYLEWRAILDCRDPSQREIYLKRPSLCADEDEKLRLKAALAIRRRQALRKEALPWSAFDVARGQHYLSPNVLRFQEELQVAADDAYASARTSADRWMLDTAARSLRKLRDARVPIDGLDDALELLEKAADPTRWGAGNWEPLSRRIDPYLAKEMGQIRAELKNFETSNLSPEDRKRLKEFLVRAEQTWTAEDEQAFQRELEDEAYAWEPPQKKAVRILWKIVGGSSVTEIIGLLADPAPGNTVSWAVGAAFRAKNQLARRA